MNEKEIEAIVRYYEITHSNNSLSLEEINFIQEFNKIRELNKTLNETVERLMTLPNYKFNECIEKIKLNLNKNKDLKINEDGREIIAKKYQIDINLITEYKLENGTKIFKFTDPKTGTPVALYDNGKDSLAKQLSELQENNRDLQSSNSKDNTYGTLNEMEAKNKNKLEYISFDEIDKHKDILENMTEEERKKLDYFMQNKMMYPKKIEKINLATLTIIDDTGTIYEARKDTETQKYELYEPVKSEYAKDKIETSENINIENAEETTVTSENTQELYDEYNKLSEEKKNVLIELTEHPENLDLLPEEKRNEAQIQLNKYKLIIQEAIKIKNQEEAKEMALNNEKVKVLTLNKDNNHGYMDALLLSFITGLFGGILLTIGYLIINR